MAGKRIRSRNSHSSIPVTNLSNRTVLQTANVTNTPGPKVPDDLLALTKEQLKAECRRRGQKTSGTKVELLQRLGHKMTGGKKAAASSAANGSVGSQVSYRSAATSTSHPRKQREREERERIVLWKQPVRTIVYFTKEVFVLLYTYGEKMLEYKKTVLGVVVSVLMLVLVMKINGPHQPMVESVSKTVFWCSYWIGLGILSSVGLGTGLHTFLLYLGPHIAKVTLAAYECGTLNFPEPPYPDEIICPLLSESSTAVSIFSIMSKVRLEAMCWGAGTALGELPPYFMARASRLSGYDSDDDDDMQEFEELQRKANSKEQLTPIERGKLMVEHIVQKIGFFGILACASIPNPLFDLAGITCGHFLVPFWTFFGATLIGKAVIKMHIQKLFVIIAFSETLITTALDWLGIIPIIGSRLQIPFKNFLEAQKLKLHRSSGPEDVEEAGSLLSSIFEKLVFAMILYFIISIINSLAQSHHKRLHQKKSSAKATD